MKTKKDLGLRQTAGNGPVRLADAGNRIAVLSDVGGFRFHFWLSKESGEPVDSNIYKNPLPRIPLAYQEKDVVVLCQHHGEGREVTERMLQAAEMYLPAYLGCSPEPLPVLKSNSRGKKA